MNSDEHLGDYITNTKNHKTTLNSYIGHTCNTLSDRLTCHLSKYSAIQVAYHEQKHTTINIRQIYMNTQILYRTQCNKRLKILESILIQNKQPILNKIYFPIGDNILKCV